MPRTTLDLDSSILRELKRLGRKEGKSLGELVSELVAQALPGRLRRKPAAFEWTEREMGAPRVDLKDKDAVWRVLDEDRSR